MKSKMLESLKSWEWRSQAAGVTHPDYCGWKTDTFQLETIISKTDDKTRENPFKSEIFTTGGSKEVTLNEQQLIVCVTDSWD